MLIAVIGGKLQGVEVVYLAQKAGYQTLLIDKNPDAPAAGLSDRFMQFEFNADHPFPRNLPHIDLILPAIEDETVLTAVTEWARSDGIPLAFDLAAYRISSSKSRSDALFKRMNLPAPKPWPHCRFPVVVKPDQASGSQGVEIIKTPEDLSAKFPTRQPPDSMIIQEFLEGPSYSIEVLGQPGHYQAVQVTDLGMDTGFDCNRITAPTHLPDDHIRRFKEMGIAIAEEIRLTGIVDVEVIHHQEELKLLEIDARFPSQTPITVYWSTGINMVEIMTRLFVDKCQDPLPVAEHPVLVEHIQVCGPEISFPGEHVMSGEGPLTVKTDFFGADEAITSFDRGGRCWVATMIFTGPSENAIEIKRKTCYDRIASYSESRLKDPAS